MVPNEIRGDQETPDNKDLGQYLLLPTFLDLPLSPISTTPAVSGRYLGLQNPQHWSGLHPEPWVRMSSRKQHICMCRFHRHFSYTRKKSHYTLAQSLQKTQTMYPTLFLYSLQGCLTLYLITNARHLGVLSESSLFLNTTSRWGTRVTYIKCHQISINFLPSFLSPPLMI